MRPTIVLVLGLITSTLTALLVYRAVQRPAPPPPPIAAPPPDLHTSPVVVAAHDMPLGTTLDERDLKTIDWPQTALPANAYAGPETLVGRVTIARLVGNEPVTNDKLAPVGTRGLLPLVIEPGMRAVTVKVNEVTAVGGFMVPGSRVDVLVTADVRAPAEVPGGPNGQTAVQPVAQRHTRTLLQNVTVLALGQVLEYGGDPKPPGSLTTATLLVLPDQGELLALAAAEGQLHLVLRNFADNTMVASGGKTAEDLFDLPPRAPRTVPTNQVEMIRGGDRIIQAF